MPKDLLELIQFLQANNFNDEFPNSNGTMDLSETALFDAENFTPEAKELLKERKQFNKDRKEELKVRSGKMNQKIETTMQSVNIGFILERLAPELEGCRFDKNDCRSLFDLKGQMGTKDFATEQYNEKLTIADKAANPTLPNIENELKRIHRKDFSLNSFILLRDSSELSKIAKQTGKKII